MTGSSDQEDRCFERERKSMTDSGETALDLWHRIVTSDALLAAWAKVLANGGSPGGDGQNLADFGNDTYANIMQLRAELLQGTYRARSFRKVAVPKRKPGYRVLTIPSVRDRVVHTAVATALTPIMEAIFQDCSFAYRPNRGVVQAVQRIEQWRKRGFEIVVEADIIDYFGTIDHALLLDKLNDALGQMPGGPAVLALVSQNLHEQAEALGTPGQGLAQGSPLSPLLANLYLDALDEVLESQAVKLVRFADDFVILCKSMASARTALEHCRSVLDAHGLQLHDDGTHVVSFEQGFDFIGYLFLKSLSLKEKRSEAIVAPDEEVKFPIAEDGTIEIETGRSRFDPGKRVLYVLDPSHEIARRNRSFSVLRSDRSELIAIPHRRVGRIEIGPDVIYGKPAIDLALDVGIEIALIDGLGQTRGTVANGPDKRSGIQLAQARGLLDPTFRLIIARALVAARIRNQRTQLLRLNRERQLAEPEAALKAMQKQLDQLHMAKIVDEIRGMEGAATSAYWRPLGLLARPSVDDFRRSRPARDALNAAINYLTGILERDTRAAIQAVGLLPGLAFLHGTRDRHDGLIFDLMEPFRAPLTEGLAVFLFNARRLRAEMFGSADETGIAISSEGRRAIVEGYETAASRRINVPGTTGKLAWRPMMRWQAQSLVNALLNQKPETFRTYLMEA